MEAECPFINFNDLLERVEDLVVDVTERVLKSPLGHLVEELNPGFKAPKKPFKRMDYADGYTLNIVYKIMLYFFEILKVSNTLKNTI